MRIAICDDEEIFCKIFEKMCKDILDKQRVDYEIVHLYLQ